MRGARVAEHPGCGGKAFVDEECAEAIFIGLEQAVDVARREAGLGCAGGDRVARSGAAGPDDAFDPEQLSLAAGVGLR